MSELYRDFIDNEMDDVITALNGTITPTPVNSELYRNFLNRKADDIITALNGTITPAPIGDELYRDFIERKFDDVISGIGSYIPPVSFPSVSGAVCSFDSQYAGLPLKSHSVAVTGYQSGSGTPSPSNPRAISGWSEVNVGNVSDYASWFRGIYQGIYGFVDLGSLNWNYYSNVNAFYTNALQNTVKKNSGNVKASWILCALYVSSDIITMVNGLDNAITVNTIGQIYIKDTSKGTDATALTNSLDGVYLIYELATPTTPSFTDADIDGLFTAFNISGQHFTIQIGSTIYGGEYDARTGVLTVTHYYFKGGFEHYNASNGYKAYRKPNLPLTVLSGAATQIICNMVSEFGSFNSSNMDRNIITPVSSTNTLYLALDENYSSDDVEVCYKLRTPQTIQLPPCPIDTLEGVNNIFADTGDTTLHYIKIGGNT